MNNSDSHLNTLFFFSLLFSSQRLVRCAVSTSMIEASRFMMTDSLTDPLIKMTGPEAISVLMGVTEMKGQSV